MTLDPTFQALKTNLQNAGIKENHRPTRSLTAHQAAFCAVFMETGDEILAYRRAYEAKMMPVTAVRRAASQLLAKPNIQERLRQLHEPVVKDVQLDLPQHLTDLKAISQKAQAKGDFSTALQAEIARGRAAQLYVRSFENQAQTEMTIEEIDQKLSELLEKAIGQQKPDIQ